MMGLRNASASLAFSAFVIAANPFGIAAFTGDKTQDGSVTLEPGGKLHFSYRVVIHPADVDLAKLYAQYVK